MSDDSLFEELQAEFITEALFVMESYEEHMLGLESGENSLDHLNQIFRVAHSIKGGASAVGLTDLGHFAHKVEDLLALLRMTPELTNSDVISVLLAAGDEFKKRLLQLKNGEKDGWNPRELTEEVMRWTTELGGVAEKPKEPVVYLDIDELAAQAAAEEAEAAAKMAATEKSPEEVLPLGPDPTEAKPEESRPALQAAAASEAKSTASKSSGKTGSGSASATSIKVDLARVESVLDAVGEIVVLKNQLVHDESVKSGLNPRLTNVVDQLDKSVRELYEKTLGIRMTPLKSLFLKIQRIVRDVSIQVQKSVDLKIIGEETEVERTVFEILGDPMVHLVRNALDHGIEKTEIRKANNKNPVATVCVEAKQIGGHVHIEIRDDGGGINRKKILEKAIEKHLLPSGVDGSSMSDQQVFQLLFAPGFSTAEKVTDLSGRGVGLDVVKSNLERVHGKIEIESKLGVGTTFRLVIPLTTAITDGIVIALRKHQYILPTYSIKEIVRVPPAGFTKISESQRMVRIRENLLSVLELGDSLLIDALEAKDLDTPSGRRGRDEQMLVIVETAFGQIALPVDDVLGQTQAVVKPFEIGTKIPEVSGAAVLGDGSTVLILDPQALAKGEKAAA